MAPTVAFTHRGKGHYNKRSPVFLDRSRRHMVDPLRIKSLGKCIFEERNNNVFGAETLAKSRAEYYAVSLSSLLNTFKEQGLIKYCFY